MASLTERIAALTPEQRKLLEHRLRTEGGNITRQSQRDAYPLSLSQLRLWFLDAYHKGSPFYNFSFEYRILGTLNKEVLFASLAEIVRRHEALRTSIIVNGEQPLQVVNSGEDWSAELIDLSDIGGEAAKQEAKRLSYEAAKRTFDLAHGSLFRAWLLRLSPTEHLLQIVVHHIIFDGWSIKVLVKELESLYAAFAANRPSPLPELTVQYGDFSVWQRKQLEGTRLAELLAFWKKTLANLPAFEVVPDYPRPAQQTYHGAVRPFSLRTIESQFLNTWSRRHGATLFMTLLAAVTTVLMNRTGQMDIPLATAVANRNQIEIEPLIGFFVNTLVLRIDLGGNPPFSELVDRVRDVVLAAQTSQELPFEKLVEEMQPVRDPKRNPLVQILFALQERSLAKAPRFDNLEVEQLRFQSVDTTRFDLELHLWDTGKGIEGIVVYNTDLFDVASAERLSLHLQDTLSAIVADPDRRISDLPRMGHSERAEVLNEWCCGAEIGRLPYCLHEIVEQQVNRTPSRVAVQYGEQRLTYWELNQRANRLSHYLTQMGVEAEVRVGVCLNRSLDMIVALLGVLKAGGVYVPLDPAHPQERINYVLKDAHVAVLISSGQTRGALPAPLSVCVVELDGEWEQIAAQNEANPRVKLDKGNLAYVIYTSGSTGRPKGVAIQHSNAVAFSQWAQQVFSEDELSGVLASTSICFDLSVFEIFVPLSVGGRVIIVDNALDVADLSQNEHVTLINTVPSAMTELVRAKALPATLRTVNLAGEALHNALVQQIYQPGHVQRVLNLYGPSEDTTYSTYAGLAMGDEAGNAPIGRPITNSQAFVLDEHEGHQPVPVGAVGELYLGGEGLARGYLDRPDLTAERFVPNHFSSSPGGRLYRTGDRVRWLSNGTLEFLGRSDHQVKIRGYRIEFGEVEAALLTHPAVGNAVVTVQSDSAGAKQLVAYLERQPDVDAPEWNSLREHLRKSIPEYMVPAFFAVLDRLPLTPNGKVDRQALSAAAVELHSNSRSYLPPRDSCELQCAQIWEQVLGVTPIGVRDNFFELGGHSLSAFVVIIRIRKAFGCDLPISVLFERPTVEELAGILRGDTDLAAFSLLVPLQRAGTRSPFFCVHPAGGNVLCFAALMRHIGRDQPFFGVQSRALAEEELVVRSLEEIAEDYVQAIRQVQPKGPYFLGGYCIGGVIVFEMARRLQQTGEQIAALVLIDSFAPDALSKEEFDDALALSWFGRDLGMPAGKRLSIPAEELRGLRSEEAFEKVLATAKQEEVLPKETEASQLRRYFHCYLANSVAAVTYEPRLYSGPITMLHARDEEDKYDLGSSLGWRPLIDGEIEVHEIPGDHATILFEPNVQVLAERLLQVLAAAQETAALERTEAAPVEKVMPGTSSQYVPQSSTSVGGEETVSVRHAYTVKRAVEFVFAFLADPKLEPKWNPWIREVKIPSDGVLGEGSSFIAAYQFMGREFEMKLQIKHYVPPRVITFSILEGPFTAQTTYYLHEGEGGETRVEIDLFVDPKDFFGIIPKPLLRPIFQKSMKDDCRRQKQLIETELSPIVP